MGNWRGGWRLCGWCETPAVIGTHYETKDTEFGPVAICPACLTGNVGPVYGSVRWAERESAGAA